MDDYQRFIHTSRYARWLEDEQRREHWQESVNRYMEYMEAHLVKKHNVQLSNREWWMLRDAILVQHSMPSMRAMMTAGPALERCHVAAYNCSYLPIDSLRAFDEMLYILMCGTGVGFSVERQYVSELPTVPSEFQESTIVHTVEDSKEGWAVALRWCIEELYNGKIPQFNYDLLRPAGARLKTFGGRSSGPQPLKDLMEFVKNVITGNSGRKLSSLNCHDIACKIGDCVVVGGVRRSALISLSNLSDQRMRHCKSGNWYETHPYRALANNSVSYTEKPDAGAFMREWLALYDSKSGERGVFNRDAAVTQALKNGRRDTTGVQYGTNPCSEIILRPYQFCNLSEVVARRQDTIETLEEKVKIATILGTIQSTLTDFKYLRRQWRDNTEEERLLGVSLTGIYDCPLLTHQNTGLEATLEHLKGVAIATNREWANRLGIKPSAAITCVKPSGTVSQLTDAASGIHPRFAPYYIRRVRADDKDPLCQFLIDQGMPYEDDAYQPDGSVKVFSFPIRAPEGSNVRDTVSALDHLKLWRTYADHWCEHKPSITVNVREHEWVTVGGWVYNNFESISGISFLPYSDHTYVQAPYEECTKETYEAMVVDQKGVNWSNFVGYEKDDNTSGVQALACTADACEVVDLT